MIRAPMVLVLLLAACSGDKDEGKKVDPAKTGDKPAATAPAAPAAPAAGGDKAAAWASMKCEALVPSATTTVTDAKLEQSDTCAIVKKTCGPKCSWTSAANAVDSLVVTYHCDPRIPDSALQSMVEAAKSVDPKIAPITGMGRGAFGSKPSENQTTYTILDDDSDCKVDVNAMGAYAPGAEAIAREALANMK